MNEIVSFVKPCIVVDYVSVITQTQCFKLDLF